MEVPILTEKRGRLPGSAQYYKDAVSKLYQKGFISFNNCKKEGKDCPNKHQCWSCLCEHTNEDNRLKSCYKRYNNQNRKIVIHFLSKFHEKKEIMNNINDEIKREDYEDAQRQLMRQEQCIICYFYQTSRFLHFFVFYI